MRFWPEWSWLKKAVEQNTYGEVLAAQFRRVSQFPNGTFYRHGQHSGGAVLDLHVHDTDFVHYCFGLPDAVTTAGYSHQTTELDHVMTRYHFSNRSLIFAEGGWAMAAGFGFRMQFTVNFERASLAFDIDHPDRLMLWEPGRPARKIETPRGLGYEHEIDYLLRCIESRERPSVSTIRDAARTLEIIEAEVRSAVKGEREPVVSTF
jgi:predicted dehydrogenase